MSPANSSETSSLPAAVSPAASGASADPAASARRVLCNSWPKAGTHAILEVARLALGEGEWYKDWDIKYPQGDAEFIAKFTERLQRHEGKSFAIKGHYGRTPAIEAFLAEHHFAHLFAVRDPREILCSTQRWLRDLRRGWAISKHLAPLDSATQLEQIIVGLPLLAPFDLDFAVRWDQPLPGRYAALTRWLDAPGCCVLAYEDLSGKRGTFAQFAAIERALHHMLIPFDHADIVRIAGLICNPATATFHTGPTSDWETVFTDRHRQLFVEHGGEALVERLGYPPTLPARTRAPRQPAAASAPQESSPHHPRLNPSIRIVVLDEEARHLELFGNVFEQLGIHPEPAGDRSPEEILETRPDAILLSREWSYRWRLIAAAARRANVPVIYVMDGVIEWSYIWNNLSFVKPEGTVLQPLLASHLCVVGRHPARILAGLGLADRIHIVGLPRLDRFSKTRILEHGQVPKILISTAKTYAHNTEQKTFVRRALRDLKNWFEANPFVLPVWRIADQAAEDIGVSVQREGSIEQALAAASGVISFSSTCLLEAMLKGAPTAQVDYRAVPLYVQTAWEIRCAEQIPAVIQELLYPPPEKVAYQEQCLEDELEPGNASERLARVIQQAFAEARSPSPKPQTQPVANFGRFDFHQVHSQLSAFSASLQSSAQYELDALQNLYDRTRRELQAARGELRKTQSAVAQPAQPAQPAPSCPEQKPEASNLVNAARTARETAALRPASRPIAPSQKDVSAREATVMRLLQRDPANTDALARLGSLQMQQGRFMEASRTFGKLLDHKPDDLPAILCRITCELEQGDWIVARLNCLRALKLDPENADAKNGLAVIEARKNTPPPPETERMISIAKRAAPLRPTADMLKREYPCPYAFQQLYIVPRTKLDLRFCSYHGAVLFDDQDAVYRGGVETLDALLNGHPQFVARRERYLSGDYTGAGCSENCVWFNEWKTTGKGFKLGEYLSTEGKFKLGKIWLSMGPDCNVTCRYCLEPSEFKMDFNTCNPEVMNLARDFVRRGGELLLTGGETFLPKWGFACALEELVSWGDAKGTISLHTNGTYLNERNRDLLLRGPVSTVGISMDTLRKDLYEYLRRGTSYELVWGNVTSLVRERNARNPGSPVITLLCAVMKSTAGHIVETVDRAVEAGLGISLNALFQACYSPAFSAQEGLHNLSPAELEELYQNVLHIEQKHGPSGQVYYQGFKGQVENQLELARSGQGEKQVILGRGGLAAARLPHFEKVARAESLLAENRFPEAGVEIEPVLPLLKRSSRGLRVWAQVLAALNRVEESIDVCEQVLRLDPRDATASELLATLRNRASTTSTGGSSVEVPPGVCQQEKGARL